MAVTISTTRGVNLDIREIVSFPEFVEIGVPFTCELKLYNRSGGSVWGYDLYACASNSSGSVSSSVRIATTNLSKNHSSGSTATVKFSCVIEDPDNKLGTGHVLTGIKFWLWGNGNTSFVELASSDFSYLQGGEVLSTRWNPTITALSGQRYDQATGTVSDESSLVRMQIQGNAASAMAVTVMFFEDGVEVTSLRRTASSASFNFSGNYTLSSGSNWEIKITYGDKYETVENSLTIARAFANVHLSGATYRENGVNRQIGGVAFGKFSSVKSTLDASGKGTGKFECVYPAMFEGGTLMIVDEDILPADSLFQAYDGATGYKGVRFRSNGIICELFGTLCKKASATSSTTKWEVCTLPNGYAPSYTIEQICQGSTTYVWLLEVDTDGKVYISRYRSGSSYGSVGTSTWLPFHVIWIKT